MSDSSEKNIFCLKDCKHILKNNFNEAYCKLYNMPMRTTEVDGSNTPIRCYDCYHIDPMGTEDYYK